MSLPISSQRISKLERIRQRWLCEVMDHPGEVDPNEEYTWDGVLIGFLMGAGLTAAEAHAVAKQAPSRQWPI